MSQKLFRDQAVQAQCEDRLGRIGLHAPRMGWVFFWIGMASIVAFAAFLLLGRYTRHEQVQGALVPIGGLIAVTPVGPGVVARVLVREGDTVHAGQPLVEISVAQNSASLGDTPALVAEQLQRKRQRLQSDIDVQRQLEQLRRQDLKVRVAALQRQVVEKQTQAQLQRQRADSALALYEQWAGISETGIVSKVQLLQQRDVALQNRASLNDLEGQVLHLRQQAEQALSELEQLTPTLNGQLNQTERQLADIEQSMVQNAAQSAVVLQASVDGTVASMLVNAGQTVDSERSVLTLLPSQSTLLAELWVPTRAIGFMQVGKPVMIRYQAFPYQKFGQYSGQVRSVSRSATSPDVQARLLGQPAEEARYRVEVTLDSQQVSAYGRAEDLRPGMTLDADVMLDSRRLVEWVLEPLYGFSPKMNIGQPKRVGQQ